MNHDELAFVNQQLAGMLRAGIPLEGALQRLCAEMQRGRMREEFEKLEADLAQGLPLADALNLRKLPEFYSRMVQAGVKSNDLPGMLTLLADYYREVHAIWTRLKGLMVYPVIVLGLSLVLSTFLAVLLGRFYAVMNQDQVPVWNIFDIVCFSRGSRSSPSSLQLQAGFLAQVWIPPLMVALVFGVALLLSVVPRFRHEMCWSLPAFKEACLARFARAMAILLQGGCALPEALALLGQMEKGTRAGKELRRWQERCASGHGKFSELAADGKVFPPMFIWLVAGAEEDLSTGFRRAAETYRARAAYRTEVLLYCALPASLLLLGLVILGQIYPFVQFVFGLTRALGQF